MGVKKKTIFLVVALLVFAMTSLASADYRAVRASGIADLSCLLSSDLPCWWPGLPEYQSIPYREIGPAPWRSNLTIIDEHVGTHFDAPCHWVPPLSSGLPHAAVPGEITAEKVPIWQFGGEACVIDVSKILDQAPNGKSPIITKGMVQAWERRNRNLGPGDVVIFRSGYDDKYYKPFPAGRRLLAEPSEGKAPAFPAPDADCIKYIVSKGVMNITSDSPSLGPFPGAPETHYAGLGVGAIYPEMLINCGGLPDTGSFFIFLPPKFEGASGGPGRAIAITQKPLATDLIEAVKLRKIVDLSVIDGPGYPDYWPGSGVGNYSYIHLVAPFAKYSTWRGPYYTNTHIFDEHIGTHFDPPSHFLPDPGFDNAKYGDWTKGVLADYESKYGKRGNSDVYAADYPVHQMMGPARVIDVTHLVGTTSPDQWPRSPAITVADVKKHEKLYGSIQAGDVVMFKAGWSDRYYKKAPNPNGVADALNGKIEGWPSPTPETMLYLAKKGVKCVGSDGGSLGAVTGKEAVQTHWAGLTQGMNYPEFLTNLGVLPPKGAFFIFLPLKEKGVRGGVGRAVGILP
jgi:kynurenine formamidase